MLLVGVEADRKATTHTRTATWGRVGAQSCSKDPHSLDGEGERKQLFIKEKTGPGTGSQAKDEHI